MSPPWRRNVRLRSPVGAAGARSEPPVGTDCTVLPTFRTPGRSVRAAVRARGTKIPRAPVLLLRHSRRVKRRHLVHRPGRALYHRERQKGARALAEAQVQVDQGTQAQFVEGRHMARFGAAVAA